MRYCISLGVPSAQCPLRDDFSETFGLWSVEQGMHGECFSELSFWNLEPFPIIASSRNDGSGLETMGHCDVGNPHM